MSDIQKFSMEDVQRRVAETIKAQFAMLIPDEAFNNLAQAAIKDFFETETSFQLSRIRTGSYSSTDVYELTTQLSPFKQMLWEEVRKLTQQKLKEYMTQQELELQAKLKELFDDNQQFQGTVTENVAKLAAHMAAIQQHSILQQAAGAVNNSLMQLAARNSLVYP